MKEAGQCLEKLKKDIGRDEQELKRQLESLKSAAYVAPN